MLQKAVLIILFLIASALTIHQMAYQRDCVDFECERNIFEQLIDNDNNNNNNLSNSNGTIEHCRTCQHCTITGYSVCIRLGEENKLRARRGIALDNTSSAVCACMHHIPITCADHTESIRHQQKSTNESTKLFNICYLSALQSPPQPQAENKQNSVIVTIEPFWLQSYWKNLHLSNLTVHYEYPVSVAANCDGNVTTTTANAEHLMCNAILQIDMSDPMESSSVFNEHQNNENMMPPQSDTVEYYDYDGFSEVQFDRAVFAGADYVKLWYTVDVKRPRQLNLHSTDSAIVDVHSYIASDSLTFDLETSKYENDDNEMNEGDEKTAKDSDQRDIIIIATTDERRSNQNHASSQLPKEKTPEEIAKEVDFFAEDDARPIPQDEYDELLMITETNPDDELLNETDSNSNVDKERFISTSKETVTGDELIDEFSTDSSSSSSYQQINNPIDQQQQQATQVNQKASDLVVEMGTARAVDADATMTNEREKDARDDDDDDDDEGSNEERGDGDMINMQPAIPTPTSIQVDFDHDQQQKDDEQDENELQNSAAEWNVNKKISSSEAVRGSDEPAEGNVDYDVEGGGSDQNNDNSQNNDQNNDNSSDQNDDDDNSVIAGVLKPGRELDYNPWQRKTPATFSRVPSGPVLDQLSVVTSTFNEQTTDRHHTYATPIIDSITENALDSIILNDTQSIFDELFDKFFIKQHNLIVLILCVAIFSCVLLLCIFCCIRKRKMLRCSSSSSSSSSQSQSSHSAQTTPTASSNKEQKLYNKRTNNGLSAASYKYTLAANTTQSRNIDAERERLHHHQ